MNLVSRGLVAALSRAGLCNTNVSYQGAVTLGEWLQQQKIESTHPAIERYFGVPYLFLEGDFYVTIATLMEYQEWPLYYDAQAQCYLCVRPPYPKELAAFRGQYGEVPLYVTDECIVQAALLYGALPAKQHEQGGQRIYDVRELLRQGFAHIDGMIGMMIYDALKKEATDIHLYATKEEARVVFRIHGELRPYVVLTQRSVEPLFNKLKLMAEMDIAERRLPQDGHMAVVLDEALYHLRLGTLPLLWGEKIVIRILPAQQKKDSFRALGFDMEQVALLKDLLKAEQGLLLLTGPTNSGKTTSLYACLKMLAEAGKLVYTIEDPVEAVVDGVQQSQVNVRGGYSFVQGLRGMLRSDPDVLAIGELRDCETVDIAARAALSGHLVIATLHASNAHQAVNRLRDLGLSDLMLSAVLLGVVNQRLVTAPCTFCGGSGMDISGKYCMHCQGSGSVGRSGIQEIWVPTAAERAQIEGGMNSVTMRQNALRNGFRSLEIVAKEKQDVVLDDEER